jgi:hypothetical protein
MAAGAMRRHGLSDVEICGALGIKSWTFYRWLRDIPEFSQALTRSDEEAAVAVRRALFKRATGMTIRTKKVNHIKFGSAATGDERVEIIESTYREELPPDVSAATFWLRRRDPAFRDEASIGVDVMVAEGDQALAKLLGIARGAKR